MCSLVLQVPRVIYVNAATESELLSSLGRSTKKTLPRKVPVRHLYEVEMPERRYLRNSKEITRLMMDPNILGVYETKVCVCACLCVLVLPTTACCDAAPYVTRQTPLLHKLLLNVGCVAQVNGVGRASLMSNPKEPITLDTIDFITTTTHGYLEPSSSSYRRMFLFHASCDNRAVVALFIIEDTNVSISTTAATQLLSQTMEQTPGRKSLHAGTRHTLAQSRSIGTNAFVSCVLSTNMHQVFAQCLQAVWTFPSQRQGTCGSLRRGIL